MSEATNFKILIADDEPMLRKSMSVRISHDGFEVLQAENGKVGFESAKENLPQVIVTDLMMPVMNGAELLARLKGDATTAHIPVIILSNVDNEESFNQLTGNMVSLNGTKIVSKADLKLDELVHLINQALALFSNYK